MILFKSENLKKMRRNNITLLGIFALGLIPSLTGCLKHGMEDLKNSSLKTLTTVDYTYRFTYNDTIRKGTPNEEIQKDRVCEVLFNKKTEVINENGMDGFRTTISYNLNSVLKSGPTGSVTKEMLYAQFQALIPKDQLSKLWVYVTIPDAATVSPLNGAPKLGMPGDFSQDRTYRVTAADGTYKDYIIKTVKGF